MDQFQYRFRSAIVGLAISLLCVFTVACDSTSDDFTNSNNTNNGTNGGAVSFVGRFLGANALDNNQSSEVDVTVNSLGEASGTLIVNPAVTAQALNLNPGTFPVTGTASLTTGSFILAGNMPGFGDFTINGFLPGNLGQSTYQFTVNGQTFQGVIQPASLGTPNIGNNGGTGGGGATNLLIQGGTLSNFTFSPSGGYNGPNPPVSEASAIGGAVGTGQDGTQTATIVLSETEIMGTTARVRTFVVSINAPNGEPLRTGQAYQLAMNDTDPGAVIALSTSEGVNVLDGWSLVQGTTGQATIIAADNNSITIDFEFTGVGPNTGVVNNPSTGNFSTSGRVVGNFASVPGQ